MNPSPPRVLIADDDEHLVDVLRRRCTHLGLQVETAHDGMTVLNSMDAREPDLLILDINMPHGNGLDLCQMLAANEHTRHVPVIILTGRKDEHTIRRCHHLMAYYVPKCTDVWARIEPLLGELLRVAPAPVPVCSQSGGNSCSNVPSTAPAAAHDMPAPADELLAEEPPAAAAIPTVLCIDDDSHFAYSLKLRLEGHGVHVQRAASGMEGYRTAFVIRPKAIVLDFEMTDGNGDYVLRRLKENPYTQPVPVIVLTGQRDKALERRMAGLGAACFLNKPVQWAELWSELERHLSVQQQAIATEIDVEVQAAHA